MPSINDVYNRLVEVNANLQQIHADMGTLTTSTDAVKASVDQMVAQASLTNQRLGQISQILNAGFGNVSQGLHSMITLQGSSIQLQIHQTRQSDTIICILEQVAQRICSVLNEAHKQTEAQEGIGQSVSLISELYEMTNPGATLERARLEKVRQDLLACCPPEEPTPVCTHEPCEAPGTVGDPPRVDYPGFQPVEVSDQ